MGIVPDILYTNDTFANDQLKKAFEALTKKVERNIIIAFCTIQYKHYMVQEPIDRKNNNRSSGIGTTPPGFQKVLTQQLQSFITYPCVLLDWHAKNIGTKLGNTLNQSQPGQSQHAA